MPVSFQNIHQGKKYTRPQLAEQWGFKGYEAISRGIVTPKGSPYIILFITKKKQSFLTQYEDVFEDGVLEMEGETNHAADQRILNAAQNGDEIHLFFRKKHHSPFVYEGRIHLSDYKLNADKPSRFRLVTDQWAAVADTSLNIEGETQGTVEDFFIPDEEGRKKYKKHVTYERSLRNRAKAVEIHGTTCLACGFNFKEIYGPFAADYIEIHHVQSITMQDGTSVDPEKDLIPLCSNCHSMAHRERGRILSLSELKELLTKKRLG